MNDHTENGKLVESIIENSDIGILVTSLEGSIIKANPEFCRLTGIDPGSIGSLNLFEIFHDRDVKERIQDEVLVKNGVFRSILRLDQTNKPVWVKVSVKQITLERSNCFLISAIDISECKMGEKALAKSEGKYRLLAENVTDVIWTTDLELNFTYVSPSVFQLRGFKPEEVMDQTLDEVMTPDSLERILKMSTEFIEREFNGELDPNHTEMIEIENYRKDGSIVWVEIHLKFLRNERKETIGIMGISRDISKRRKAEKELQIKDNKLQESQKMARIGYWNWDVETGHVEWSDEVYKIFKLDPNIFTPQIDSILSLSPWPEENKRDQELIQKAMKSHETGSYEQRFLFPDGKIGYYSSTFKGAYDTDGNLISISGTVQDQTERKRAEETIKKEKEQVEFYLDLLGHDLGNIHQGIFGFLQLLEAEVEGSDPRKRYLDVAMESVLRSISLSNEVILLSRIRNEEIKLIETDISKVIENAFDQASRNFPGKICTFERENLDLIIPAEPILRELFYNIFHNSMKLQNNKPWIRVEAIEIDNMIKIKIHDKGPGISDDMKENIFLKFGKRGEKIRRGMGLSIVKAIVDRFEGNIEVNNRIKNDHTKGAEFVISLPFKAVNAR